MSNLSTINLGSAANDGTGDDARTAGGKLNDAIAYLNHQLVVWSAGELFPLASDNLLRVWEGKVYELVADLPYTAQVGISPDGSDDWVLVFPIALNSKQDKIPSIPIKNRQYQLHKHLNNNDPTKLATRQNNDIVYNVQWSPTEVWEMAMCIDETKDADDFSAWLVLIAKDSEKLGGELPAYYAPQATTYTQTQVDDLLVLFKNQTIQLLLDNPDVEINSITELLNQMTNADDSLIASIAEKVSYVAVQNLTASQKERAQKNIGVFNQLIDVFNQLATKVDKVSGKVLSSNDFTNALKNKLDGVQMGAEVNEQSDWNAASGDAFIKNKPTTFPPANHSHNEKLDVDGDGSQLTNVAKIGLANTFTETQNIRKDESGIGAVLTMSNGLDEGSRGRSNAIEFLSGKALDDGLRLRSYATGTYGNTPELRVETMDNGGGWVEKITLKNNGDIEANNFIGNGSRLIGVIKTINTSTLQTSATLNSAFPFADNPEGTIVVNKDLSNSFVYIRISSTDWKSIDLDTSLKVSTTAGTLSDSKGSVFDLNFGSATTLTIPTGVTNSKWTIITTGSTVNFVASSGVTISVVANGKSTSPSIGNEDSGGQSATLIRVYGDTYRLIK